MKYVIGKKHNPYSVTNDKAVCEVLSEYAETGTGIEKLKVRVLYQRYDMLFEKFRVVDGNEFTVWKRFFREIKDADSYVKRHNTKILKNVPNKKRILEIIDVNKKIPEVFSF